MTINLDQYTNTLNVTDTATNADLNVTTKGTGSHNLNTGNGTAFRVSDLSGTIVAGLGVFAGSSSQNSVYLVPYGSAGTANTVLASKGAGSVFFATNTNNNSTANNQVAVTHTASAVNYIQVSGSVTGSAPYLLANGSDTDVPLVVTSKGAGTILFKTAGGAPTQLAVTHTASAVNYVQVTGSSTGNDPTLSVQGSDTNINFAFVSKGSSIYTFASQGGSNRQFRIDGTSASVNYLNVSGSGTGSAPVLSALGSDTNIDLAFTPKGTGNVRFGTYTANTALTIQGYVEIKDSGGTVRRLAVIA
jgi:hypothetical protein